MKQAVITQWRYPIALVPARTLKIPHYEQCSRRMCGCGR
jgi:hypothetical protein